MNEELGSPTMKITARLTGVIDPPGLDWPEGWPVPREGDIVSLPGVGPLQVRTVVWYPAGDGDDDEGELDPFVYVVIGPPRPR
jgi:hypothetical protein